MTLVPTSGSRESARGFTLIELLVVCAIIIVISALILVDNNKFGGDVTLENLAYDVALTLRQTQVYGIAVERFGNGNCIADSSNCFSAGYGMHFALSDPTHYYLFADLENTGVFDANYPTSQTYPDGEIVETDALDQGYYITGLCVVPEIGGTTCTPVSEVDILYKRPEPEAYISASASNSPPASCVQNPLSDCYFESEITLEDPKGDTRTVLVDATGQISVQQP